MYDIVFISYNEPYANTNYFQFVTTFTGFNRLHRVHGVKGIKEAHIEAAKKVKTPMFYVIDADAEILHTFKFTNQLNTNEEDIVHVWHSRNPINGLEYGHGGIKLLPTNLTLHMDISAPDMTTSISKRFKVIKEVSNINKFNTDALSTWRTAFRECVKLSSRIIPGQLDKETTERLNTWCYNNSSAPFSEYARGGASAGEWFGKTYKDDNEMLSKINDYDWLEAEFEQHIKMFPPETFK